METSEIVIDSRMQGMGGIGTYITQLRKRLPLEYLNCSAPIYTIREQLFYPFEVQNCDVFFSPHFNVPLFPIRAKKRVVTIHDVYHLDHRSQFSKIKYRCAKMLYAQAIRASDLVITVSDFSKGRIVDHFPNAKVEVIPLGSDHLTEVDPIDVAKVPSSFYLFVGSMKPHKNRQFLDGLPIVEAMGGYSQGELVWLYQHAEALIFPSLYEGFGLPPLEAMSLGCPVLASNQTSIPEVCGNAALYFDPQNRKSLDVAIETLPFQRNALIERGKKRASELTWDQCAKRHHDLFLTL